MENEAYHVGRPVLRERWRQWSAIVERCMRRRRQPMRTDSERYHSLHTALLQACEEEAGRAQDPMRGFIRELEEIAKPWVTPESLIRADRDVLLELTARCRLAQSALDGSRMGSASWRRLVPLLVFGLAAIAIYVAMSWSGSSGRDVLDRMESLLLEVAYAVKQSSYAERAIVAGVTVALLAMHLVWRSGHKY